MFALIITSKIFLENVHCTHIESYIKVKDGVEVSEEFDRSSVECLAFVTEPPINTKPSGEAQLMCFFLRTLVLR